MSDVPAGEKCCHKIFDQYPYRRCAKPAKMQHEGEFYCGIHDPVKRAAKRTADAAATELRYKQKMAQWGRESRITAARNAVIEAARDADARRGSWDAVAVAVALLREAEHDH